MAARTGKEFLQSLKSAREVWVGDDKVTDVGIASRLRRRRRIRWRRSSICSIRRATSA